MIVMDIAEYARLIKDERQRQGISQTDMAQRLGVSRRWLIELNTPESQSRILHHSQRSD